MSFKPLTSLRRGFGMFWRGLDATRRFVLNMLFLGIVIALLVAENATYMERLSQAQHRVEALLATIPDEAAGDDADVALTNDEADQ